MANQKIISIIPKIISFCVKVNNTRLLPITNEINDNRIENTTSFDGIANLVFNNGSETLTTNFDKWYNVTVTSNTNKDNYVERYWINLR